jgi:transcriptional regulator with XRE-family HTH domain
MHNYITDTTLLQRLKQLHLEKNITQLQLAQRISVTKYVISAYENSLCYPSYDVLIKIASLFGAQTDYLLGQEEKRYLEITALISAEK